MSFVKNPLYVREYHGFLMEISPQGYTSGLDRDDSIDYFLFEDQRLMYADKLMRCFSGEETLSGGRFHNFEKTVSSNPIEHQNDGHLVSVAFEAIVNWIADNAKGRWSFHLRCDTKNLRKRSPLVIITIFFEDATDSMIYRLHLP